MSPMITAVAAFLIDALIGDPRSRFHPVVLIGKLIFVLEYFLRRDFDTNLQKMCKGAMLVIIVFTISYDIGALIEFLAEMTGNHTAEIFIEAGSGKTLCGFNRRIDRAIASLNVENVDSLNKTLNAIRQ